MSLSSSIQLVTWFRNKWMRMSSTHTLNWSLHHRNRKPEMIPASSYIRIKCLVHLKLKSSRDPTKNKRKKNTTKSTFSDDSLRWREVEEKTKGGDRRRNESGSGYRRVAGCGLVHLRRTDRPGRRRAREGEKRSPSGSPPPLVVCQPASHDLKKKELCCAGLFSQSFSSWLISWTKTCTR